MTAPSDPFRTPDERDGAPAYGAPADPYGGQPGPPPGTPAYGAPAYGTPAYGTPVGGAPRNGMGVAALVLGVLALVTAITVVGGILFGVLAIVFGVIGRGRARRREATNGGLATAGIALGLLGLLASVALIAVGASLLNSDSGQAYQDCLKGAGSDQAAIQQCAREFSKKITS